MIYLAILIPVFVVTFVIALLIIVKRRIKTINEQYDFDAILGNDTIKNLPKEYTLATNVDKQTATFVAWEAKKRLNNLNLECNQCKNIFSIGKNKRKTKVRIIYNVVCPSCSSQYEANLYMNEALHNMVTLTISKK